MRRKWRFTTTDGRFYKTQGYMTLAEAQSVAKEWSLSLYDTDGWIELSKLTVNGYVPNYYYNPSPSIRAWIRI